MIRNTCTCTHCDGFRDARHGNGCVGYHCKGTCLPPGQDITTADLQVELPAGHPLLAALREVAEYKNLGAETWMLPGADLEPYAELREMDMVSWGHEDGAEFEPDGWTPVQVLIIKITERGLEELVLHGRERA